MVQKFTKLKIAPRIAASSSPVRGVDDSLATFVFGKWNKSRAEVREESKQLRKDVINAFHDNIRILDEEPNIVMLRFLSESFGVSTRTISLILEGAGIRLPRKGHRHYNGWKRGLNNFDHMFAGHAYSKASVVIKKYPELLFNYSVNQSYNPDITVSDLVGAYRKRQSKISSKTRYGLGVEWIYEYIKDDVTVLSKIMDGSGVNADDIVSDVARRWRVKESLVKEITSEHNSRS